MRTITFSLEPGSRKANYQAMYDDFMSYEHTTPQKELWLEQKRIFDSILNAEDFDAALDEFQSHGLTCAATAEKNLRK